MGGVKYGKYEPELDLDELLKDLLHQIQDQFLFSGFGRSRNRRGRMTLDDLYDAILEALLRGDLLDEELLQSILETFEGSPEDQMDALIQTLIQQLQDQGYIAALPEKPSALAGEGFVDDPDDLEPGEVRLELTDKSLDFLGYRNLKDIFQAFGDGAVGAHDTSKVKPSIEAYMESKPYAFGDTLELDVQRTLLNAIKREGPKVPLKIQEKDLYVRQGEIQQACATVIMLDCSHSMILYGEDRFTPAKKVALALAHLIRTQFPGDTIDCVLFHDSAEVISLRELARARVGPFYTNTCEGLKVARRVLLNRRRDMRQILLITDGKPSALTLPDGRIYRNPYGLDPLIIRETLREVVRCRKAGITINTFMLTDDPFLVRFVQKMTALAKGKAYFTTPMNLGQAMLMDFVNHKVRYYH